MKDTLDTTTAALLEKSKAAMDDRAKAIEAYIRVFIERTGYSIEELELRQTYTEGGGFTLSLEVKGER